MLSGIKYDKEKLRWSLLPYRAVQAIVKILTFGANKYSPDNWRKVDNLKDRYFSALMRHLVAWKMGEIYDPESGEHHLSHAGCNLLFILETELEMREENKNE